MSEQDSIAIAEPVVKSKASTDKQQKNKRQPRYNVVLWDDDDHSYEYVVLMMKQLFAHPLEKGTRSARTI